MNKPTGGPAFPYGDFSIDGGHAGITIRDYFAAKALEGLLASDVNSSKADFVSTAYTLADMMLAERDK